MKNTITMLSLLGALALTGPIAATAQETRPDTENPNKANRDLPPSGRVADPRSQMNQTFAGRVTKKTRNSITIGGKTYMIDRSTRFNNATLRSPTLSQTP